MFDKIHEECGVFGIFNNDDFDVTQEIYLGLYALQHRGQKSCGIAVTFEDKKVEVKKGLGLVPEVFNAETLQSLASNGNGRMGVGHVRYASDKFSEQANTQPLVLRYAAGTMSVVNNGSLVNSQELINELSQKGSIFQTTSNAEIIAYLVARERLQSENIEQAVEKIMPKLKGAYSFILMSPQKLIAARDPNGFRPLCLGKLKESYIVASESCAITSIGGEFIRDIEPGEIVVIRQSGVTSIKTHCGQKTSACIFEHVYFARPDTIIDGVSVSRARHDAGKYLARMYPVEADVVIGVPDSGIEAAMGYAKEAKIPFEIGFIKNRYIGRTFIQTTSENRSRSVQIKLNPIKTVVDGKRVVLVDDSIVRGTTCMRIVELLRKAGAKEVHFRISSPPFKNPCYFGTDISSRDNLIACQMTEEEIAKSIGVDSLGYLSLEDLHKIGKGSKTCFCDACFTGNYPMDIPEEVPVDKFSIKIKK